MHALLGQTWLAQVTVARSPDRRRYSENRKREQVAIGKKKSKKNIHAERTCVHVQCMYYSPMWASYDGVRVVVSFFKPRTSKYQRKTVIRNILNSDNCQPICILNESTLLYTKCKRNIFRVTKCAYYVYVRLNFLIHLHCEYNKSRSVSLHYALSSPPICKLQFLTTSIISLRCVVLLLF